MKKLNERCPLQSDCERICEYENREQECDYYQGNSQTGFEMPTLPEITSAYENRVISDSGHGRSNVYARNLVMVDIDKIYPNPKKPRKELGDLTELVESIRISGVLQNLIIGQIKNKNSEEGYIVIIGHRRLAAAKLAGLKQIPCVISNMDEKEQIRTMMIENIQRSDLAAYEQAQGFQTMLDLGDSVKRIAEKTGFSKSTIRHRTRLLGLDKAKFRKAVKRGGALQDYIDLEQIKSPELKNRVLDSIGTKKFHYELKRARQKEKKEERRAALIRKLKAFAVQVEASETKNLKYIQSFYSYRNEAVKKPEDSGHRKYYFVEFSYYVMLYADPTEKDKVEDITKAVQEKQQKERREGLNEIADWAYQRRFDFIKGFPGRKKTAKTITEMAVHSIILTGYKYEFDKDLFCELLGLEYDEDEEIDFNQLTGLLKTAPERVLLIVGYAKMRDYSGKTYHDWQGAYKYNESLDLIYDYLERLGYQMSEEERAYQNGTHKLFKEINWEVREYDEPF